MGKLFSLEEDSAGQTDLDLGIDAVDPSDETEDLGRYTEMSLESVKTALGQFEMVRTMRDSLTTKSLLSDGYMASLESCRATIASWELKPRPTHIPALESFSNPYSAKASHQIALEGITDFVKKIWEKLKKFFSDFFKRVTLFFKRVLRMELDLESYETYSRHLVAKLKNLKGVNNKNQPISSKLPRMLATAGMEKIDEAWLVRQGFEKIFALQETIKRIGFSPSSPMVKGDLFTDIEDSISVLAGQIASGQVTADLVTAADKAIKAKSFALLDSVFAYVARKEDLPDEVFERMNDEYIRSTTVGSDFTIRAVVDMTDGRDSLPSGVNMFLFHINQDDIYITSSSSDNTHVGQSIMPVSSLGNLVNMEEDYRKRFKTFTMKGTDRFVDQTSDRITKLLKILELKLEKVNKSPAANKTNEGSTIDTAVGVMFDSTHGTTADQLQAGLYAKAMIDADIGGLMSAIWDTIDNATNREAAVSDVNKLIGKYPEKVGAVIAAMRRITTQGTAADSPAVDTKVAEGIKALNKYLLNFLTRLQVMLRDIMTNFYSVYTQLRFELVKYIYESARQFSY